MPRTPSDYVRGDCPETVRGRHGTTDRAGRCPYCGSKIVPPMRRAAIWTDGDPDRHSPIIDAYRRFWDPDWGLDPTDGDPW
jgi:DNA-directed RNA polymerase subunit RPC12/RpoP